MEVVGMEPGDRMGERVWGEEGKQGGVGVRGGVWEGGGEDVGG
jgi:hypothetical protein